MLQDYSSGYCLWRARVDEQAVDQAVVRQDVFDELSSKIYSESTSSRTPVIMKIGEGHIPVRGSREIDECDTLALPIADDRLRKRIPFTAGVLVAKEWFVRKVAGWEHQPF